MAVQRAVLRLVAGLVEGSGGLAEMPLAIGEYSGSGGPIVPLEHEFGCGLAERGNGDWIRGAAVIG
jgi:hypothetical protein